MSFAFTEKTLRYFHVSSGLQSDSAHGFGRSGCARRRVAGDAGLRALRARLPEILGELNATPAAAAVIEEEFARAYVRGARLANSYNPSQPRVPAGSPEGGQWAPAGGGFSSSPTTKTDKKGGSNAGDQTESRGSGGALESAAHDTLGDAGASPGHSATEPERRARIAAEERRLRQWAKDHGKLGGSLPKEDARGGEHTVELDETSQRVVKATRADVGTGYGMAKGDFSQGATPGEYLDRLATHNRVFDDDVRLERVVERGGKLYIVTSQPFIAGRDATPAEISGYMKSKGFVDSGHPYGVFYHPGEGLLAYDLTPKNVKVDGNGRVHPIDPVLQRVDSGFAAFAMANPNLIQNREATR